MTATAAVLPIARKGTGGRVVMINPSNTAQHDFGPDSGHGPWIYTVAIKPLISGVVAVAKPSKPTAGKPFTVRPSGLRVVPTAGSVLPKPESYTCTAKLAGKRLMLAVGDNRGCPGIFDNRTVAGEGLVGFER